MAKLQAFFIATLVMIVPATAVIVTNERPGLMRHEQDAEGRVGIDHEAMRKRAGSEVQEEQGSLIDTEEHLSLGDFIDRMGHEPEDVKVWKEILERSPRLCKLEKSGMDCEEGMRCEFVNEHNHRFYIQKQDNLIKVEHGRAFFIKLSADSTPAYYFLVMKDCNGDDVVVRTAVAASGDSQSEKDCAEDHIDELCTLDTKEGRVTLEAKVDVTTSNGQQCLRGNVSDTADYVNNGHDGACLLSKTEFAWTAPTIPASTQHVHLARDEFFSLLLGDTSIIEEKTGASCKDFQFSLMQRDSAELDRSILRKGALLMVFGAVLWVAAIGLTVMSGGAFAAAAPIVFGWGTAFVMTGANKLWGGGDGSLGGESATSASDVVLGGQGPGQILGGFRGVNAAKSMWGFNGNGNVHSLWATTAAKAAYTGIRVIRHSLDGDEQAQEALETTNADAWKMALDNGKTGTISWLVMHGRPTEQSSTRWGGEAAKAVDGNADFTYANHGCTHTDKETNPWWKVDLGEDFVHEIKKIKIANRGDDGGERMNPFRVLVSGTAGHWQECPGSPFRINPGQVKEVECDLRGTGVKVEATKTTYLTICEFSVATSNPTYMGCYNNADNAYVPESIGANLGQSNLAQKCQDKCKEFSYFALRKDEYWRVRDEPGRPESPECYCGWDYGPPLGERLKDEGLCGYNREGSTARYAYAIHSVESCTWSSFENSFSGGYAGGVSEKFTNPTDARTKCVQLGPWVCMSITCAKDGSVCTVRGGKELQKSPSDEVTFVPASGCFGKVATEHYALGEANTDGCPASMGDLNLRQCKWAAMKLGMDFKMEFSDHTNTKGCIEYEQGVWFNHDPVGRANHKSTPICNRKERMVVSWSGAVKVQVESVLIEAIHGTCLEASERNTNGGKVHMWDCNANKNQRWKYSASAEQIKATHGKCLDAAQTNINGGLVHMWDCNTKNWNQQWKYDVSSKQIYASKSGKFPKCLDASQRNINGGKVHMWSCNVQNWNQQWVMSQQGCMSVNTRMWVDPDADSSNDADPLGLLMAGQDATIEDTAEACQARCARVTGCAHFSYWDGGECALQDENAVLRETPDKKPLTHGPPGCS